ENITLISDTEVVSARGSGRLEALTLQNTLSGEKKEIEADALLIFIGAKPHTDWIKLNIIKDKRGFIETGRDLLNYKGFQKSWKKNREPYYLETCMAGIFAAGDVRAGAMNRVASAVGEGAMAIKFVHDYLSEI